MKLLFIASFFIIVSTQNLIASYVGKPVIAEVFRLDLSRESIMYTVVYIRFHNTGKRKLTIKGYTVYWKNKQRNITLQSPISIGPDEKIERNTRIYEWIKNKNEITVIARVGL